MDKSTIRDVQFGNLTVDLYFLSTTRIAYNGGIVITYAKTSTCIVRKMSLVFFITWSWPSYIHMNWMSYDECVRT